MTHKNILKEAIKVAKSGIQKLENPRIKIAHVTIICTVTECVII